MRFVVDYRLSRFENGMTNPYRSSSNVTDNRSLFLDHPVKPDDDTKVNWDNGTGTYDDHCSTPLIPVPLVPPAVSVETASECGG